MNKDNLTFGFILAILVVANAALDYSALCVAICDVDPFPANPDFGNVLAAFMALGTSLILIGLPDKAAGVFLVGKKCLCILLLVGCVVIAAVIAGLRLVGLADTGNASISGGGSVGVDLESLVAVCLMFALSGGESVLAFVHKLDEIKGEAARLRAELVSIDSEIAAIDGRKRAAAKIVNEKMLEAAEMCKKVNEEVLQSMLGQSEGLQNSFIGYAKEAEAARAECGRSLDEEVRKLLIGQDAVCFTDDRKLLFADSGRPYRNGEPVAA